MRASSLLNYGRMMSSVLPVSLIMAYPSFEVEAFVLRSTIGLRTV